MIDRNSRIKGSLFDVAAEIAAEWDRDKNGKLSPTQVTVGSHKKVWWVCANGHSWTAAVKSRTLLRAGCPLCAGKIPIVGETDLAVLWPEVAAEWAYEKNGLLTPEHVTAKSSKKVWWICSGGHSWEATVASRTHNHTGCPYCAGKRPIVGETDLATLYPDVASQWDYEKNGTLTPEHITAKSGKKVWWIGACGHSWASTVNNRTENGNGCPYCAGKNVIVGETDLATLYPDIASQWDYEKNETLTPEHVTARSKKRVWWVCAEGHSWATTVANRTALNHACPYCAGKKPIVGETDLGTLYPAIVAGWDYEKNGALTPEHVTAQSSKRVWWVCAEGHSWATTVANRTVLNHACPYCAGKKPIVGETDLDTFFPDIAAEWDYKKNGNLMPYDVTPFSGKKIWWVCSEGHSWETKILTRTHNNTGCPYCSGRRAVAGNTDLATRFPKIAAEWDCEKNGDLMPCDVTPFSRKKVWWICSEGHSWNAVVSSRTSVRAGCPYCSGRRAVAGKTDLVTLFPEIAAEWDCEKNGDLMPCDVTPFSGKKVWWICSEGHSWNAIIASRTSKHNGCPYCAGKRPIVGKTDLATRFPKIAAEWDCEKNGDLMPCDVTPFSRKKVWWRCPKGHSEKRRVFLKVESGNCNLCRLRRNQSTTGL